MCAPRHVARVPVVIFVLVALLALPTSSSAAGDGARFFGSLGGTALNAPVVAMSSMPADDGYVIGTIDGGIFTFGAAPFHGSLGGTALNGLIVDVEITPDGDGYTVAATDGGVFTFGGAPFHGSLGDIALQQPIKGIVLHPGGIGYWLWAGDGGVFSFGGAAFLGSLGGIPLGTDVIGMAPTPLGDGYWIAAADGRVFAFGAARSFGDAPPATYRAFSAAPDGAGYTLLRDDGELVVLGSAPYHGSPAGTRFNGSMIDHEYTALADGSWLLGSDGGVLTFPGTSLTPAGVPVLDVRPLVTGLTVPWDLGFLPDGTMVFTERPGRISAVVGADVRLLATPSDVRPGGEGGLTGLAVDPDFSSNRHIYTCLNTVAGDIKVVKWRVDESLQSASRVGDLVTGIPANPSGRHSGCRLRFGPDGFLWIGTGDAAQSATPQNLASLGGKVLRVDKIFGLAAPGNPFGRVLTYGHRNVQGLAFRPGSGVPYSVEHGPNRDDEVNVIQAGGNYGWAPGPGYDESVPMTDLSRFPAAIPAVWSSGAPTLATSGGTFLDGPQWRDWDGALAVATLKNRTLRVLFFDPANRFVGSSIAITGFGRLRTPLQGPDGNLYVTTSNGGGIDQILRVVPVGSA